MPSPNTIHPLRAGNLPRADRPKKRRRPKPATSGGGGGGGGGGHNNHKHKRNSHTPSAAIDPSVHLDPYDTKPHGGGTGVLRNLARNLERQLARSAENMPATLRADKERELAALRTELAEAEARQRERKILGRYHMVRFFERKKAERALKKKEKRLDEVRAEIEGGARVGEPEGNGDTAQIENEIEKGGEGSSAPQQDLPTVKEDGSGSAEEEEASNLASRPWAEQFEELSRQARESQVDLNYTLYYPLVEKYVSLWPNAKPNETDKTMTRQEQAAKRIEMREKVRQAMEDGTLDELRNSKANRVASMFEGLAFRGAKHVAKPDSKKDAPKTSNSTRQRQGGAQSDHGKSANGVKQALEEDGMDVDMQDNEDSDGGFFEE